MKKYKFEQILSNWKLGRSTNKTLLCWWRSLYRVGCNQAPPQTNHLNDVFNDNFDDNDDNYDDNDGNLDDNDDSFDDNDDNYDDNDDNDDNFDDNDGNLDDNDDKNY